MMSLDIQDEDHSMELLKTIVAEWVKLRGFGVMSLWLEDYKRSTQETIKAKKGLRKELQKVTITIINNGIYTMHNQVFRVNVMSWLVGEGFAMEKTPFPTRVPQMGSIIFII